MRDAVPAGTPLADVNDDCLMLFVVEAVGGVTALAQLAMLLVVQLGHHRSVEGAAVAAGRTPHTAIAEPALHRDGAASGAAVAAAKNWTAAAAAAAENCSAAAAAADAAAAGQDWLAAAAGEDWLAAACLEAD